MNIGPDTVVIFHYTLRNAAGEELETSRDGDPSAYLHGADNIIPGLEKAMEGKAAGESFTAELAAADAYGPRSAERQQRVPVKHLAFKGKLQPGMTVALQTSHGQVPVTVIKAGRHSADVDTNHPLAGEDLSFEIEIVDVRAATAEEVSHGHAHGPGGHHHH